MNNNEEKITVESIKQIGKTNVATRIKQCIMIFGVISITIFACMFFHSSNYLWLLALLILAF